MRSGWARNRGDWEIELELAHQSCEIQDLNRAFMKEMERDRGVGTRDREWKEDLSPLRRSLQEGPLCPQVGDHSDPGSSGKLIGCRESGEDERDGGLGKWFGRKWHCGNSTKRERG